MPTLCSVIFAIITFLFKLYASNHFLFRSVIWFSIEVLPDGGQQFTRHKLATKSLSISVPFSIRWGVRRMEIQHSWLCHSICLLSYNYCRKINVAIPWYCHLSLSVPLSLSLSPSLPQVADHGTINKMTASNLAIIFGPNLIWSTNEVASLMHLGEINSFTVMLIEHYDKVFVK